MNGRNWFHNEESEEEEGKKKRIHTIQLIDCHDPRRLVKHRNNEWLVMTIYTMFAFCTASNRAGHTVPHIDIVEPYQLFKMLGGLYFALAIYRAYRLATLNCYHFRFESFSIANSIQLFSFVSSRMPPSSMGSKCMYLFISKGVQQNITKQKSRSRISFSHWISVEQKEKK